jgi:hypothetical protein
MSSYWYRGYALLLMKTLFENVYDGQMDDETKKWAYMTFWVRWAKIWTQPLLATVDLTIF